MTADSSPGEEQIDNDDIVPMVNGVSSPNRDNESTIPTTAPRFIVWSCQALVASIWASSVIFGFYILIAYGGAIGASDDIIQHRWNSVLELWYSDRFWGNFGMGLHLMAGGLLQLAGFIQFVPRLRSTYPAFHRWTGRFYALLSILAPIGGLIYIFISGCVGGIVMDVAFARNGLYMMFCAVHTVRHAYRRRIDEHRPWAIRLVATVMSSWVYRIEYSLWAIVTGGTAPGHRDDFQGWFDYIMDFWYVPLYMSVELWLRWNEAKRQEAVTMVQNGGEVRKKSLLLLALTISGVAVVLLCTFVWTVGVWAPRIGGDYESMIDL